MPPADPARPKAFEVAENVVHDVPTALYLHNFYLRRDQTCNIHDNYFDMLPASNPAAASVAAAAGLESAYRDLLAP